MNTPVHQFYQHLYNEKSNINDHSICNFLSYLTVTSLPSEQLLSCEGNLTDKEIYNSLISFENNISPGNDGLTKELYCIFFDDIRDTFMKSLKNSKQLKYFCASQQQAIIKLLEKPNKDKRYISDWRPISSKNIKEVIKEISNLFIFL